MTIIESSEHLRRFYPLNKKYYESLDGTFGTGVFRKLETFISDFYEGSCHTMDLYLSKGQCVFVNICDFVVDRREGGGLLESYCEFPSKVFSTEVEIERIKNYIMENIKLFDYFEDGIFNVDFIVTDLGVKIIDFNPRVPGWYHNEFIRKINGVCTYLSELILNVNTIFIPVAVPAYFSIQSKSYRDPKEAAGFDSEHDYEISNKIFYVDENLHFSKINVYKKH